MSCQRHVGSQRPASGRRHGFKPSAEFPLDSVGKFNGETRKLPEDLKNDRKSRGRAERNRTTRGPGTGTPPEDVLLDTMPIGTHWKIRGSESSAGHRVFGL